MKRVGSYIVLIAACVSWILTLHEIVRGQKPELMVQTGHSTEAQSVAFSPDGKLLASGSVDGVIKLWDVASRVPLRSLEGHSGQISSVEFSPDGKLLVSGSNDKAIKLWDVTSGRLVKSLDDAIWGVSVTFSPDGKLLASIGTDFSIKLWDASSGAMIRTIAGQYLMAAFSPDGKLLASPSVDNSIKLWDVASGAQVKSLEGNYALISLVTFSPDGKLVAGVNADRKLRLWDVASGTQVRMVEEFYGTGRFSPDGKFMANSDKDLRTIKLMDVASGTTVRSMGGKAPTEAKLLVFSPDGKLLATGSSEGAIELWDVAKGAQVGSLVRHADLIDSVAFSPNGKTFVSVGKDDTIKLWNVTKNPPVKSLVRQAQANDPTSDAMAQLSRQLARITDQTQKAMPNKTTWTANMGSSIAFSPDGKLLANGNSDGTVKLWDAERGTQLKSLGGILEGLSIGVNPVAFSPDGKLLASMSFNRIKLWDVGSGGKVRDIEVSSLINSFVFGPDGKWLASAQHDKTVRLLEVASGAQLRLFEGHTASVFSVVFSPDGKWLAGAGGDNTIKVWDVASGRLVKSLGGNDSPLISVAFSPDGKLLASWGVDNMVRLWDVASGTQARELVGHSAKVTAVAFSPDGKILLSGGRDATVKLWDMSGGQLLATLVSLDKKDWFVVTPDHLFDGSETAGQRSIWRFNNNTFDYAPVEAFYAEFYYPGLLIDIFSGKRPRAKTKLEEKDIRQPQVSLLHVDAENVPVTGVTSRTAKVQVEVAEAPTDRIKKLPPAGAQDLRLFRNGSLVKIWHGDSLALGQKDGCRRTQPGRVACTVDVPIVAGENHFTAYAFNHDNVKSSDSELSIKGDETLKRKGTVYVLAIGVNKHANSEYDLKYAVADAQGFGNELKRQQDKLGLYAATEVISLTDHEATKGNILLALKRLADGERVSLPDSAPPSLRDIKVSQPEDAVIIYFAGHGTASKDRFYLIPHDLGIKNKISALDEQSLKTLLEHSISDVELESALERIDAGQLLMVIDACNSGQALEAEEKRRGPMNSKGLAQLAHEKGMHILAAAQSYQVAMGSARLGHGYLTYALVEEGLKMPVADNSPNDGQVTVREWLDYVIERVPQMREEIKEKRDLVQPVAGPATREQKAAPQEGIQQPSVFYRREAEVRPLIIVRFGVK